MTTIYTTKICPRCTVLKAVLAMNDIAFDEADLEDPANITELRINGVHVLEAPILEYRGEYFYGNAITTDGYLDKDKVLKIIWKVRT